MMNYRIAVVTVTLSVMAAAACFGASPHMGTWKLNEGKSKIAPGMGKNHTVIYDEQKGDKIKVTVDGVEATALCVDWSHSTGSAHSTRSLLPSLFASARRQPR